MRRCTISIVEVLISVFGQVLETAQVQDADAAFGSRVRYCCRNRAALLNACTIVCTQKCARRSDMQRARPHWPENLGLLGSRGSVILV